MEEEQRDSMFIALVSIIGAVLIFVGIAWLVAENWNQIPDPLKVAILVLAVILSYGSGVFVRTSGHEKTGRALIMLGALLYILTLFLISQIYNLATSMQHFAWLFFLAWTIIALTAYLLDSPENALVSLVVFFIWATVQYVESTVDIGFESFGGVVLGLVILYLSAGVLLYGLSVIHLALKHRFAGLFRFWTVFYFLAVFYVLSFQITLPMLADYSFEGGAINLFLILFALTSFLVFIFGALYSASANAISLKEIVSFVGVLLVIVFIVLSTKLGAGLVGQCTPLNCYELKSSQTCANPSEGLYCEWATEGDRSYCTEVYCGKYQNQTDCVAKGPKCSWGGSLCNEVRGMDNYEKCSKFNNNGGACVEHAMCKWKAGTMSNPTEKLPTTLWALWLLINFLFIGFIILILAYGQSVGSSKIINLGMIFFILEILTRYIGFWMNLSGYFMFGLLAILGGILLILGAWLIPKWRRNLLENQEVE